METNGLTRKGSGDISPIMRHHGTEVLRGLDGVPRSPLYEGRFGRLFRELPPLDSTDDDLITLSKTMVEGDDDEDKVGNNPHIPAGFTYLGQFVDHDITFDPNSKLQ